MGEAVEGRAGEPFRSECGAGRCAVRGRYAPVRTGVGDSVDNQHGLARILADTNVGRPARRLM